MKKNRTQFKLYLMYIISLIIIFEIVTAYLIINIESNALAPEKFNNLSSLKKEYNRIVLGDSRSHQAIDPRILDKNSSFTTYNLAAPGMQTPFMYYAAKKFIDEKEVPKQIVVNISFYLLGGMQWMDDIYFRHYKPSLHEIFDSYANNLQSKIIPNLKWYIKTHIPSLKHEGRITKLLSNTQGLPKMYKESFKARQLLLDELYQGYMPRGYKHIKDEIKLGKWNTKFHRGYSVYFHYMNRFFDLTNRYDTQIYIYEFPWPKAYKNYENLEEVHLFYTNKIKEIAKNYPNVHYLDNDNLFIEHKNFVDPLHLNNLGAELISKQLAKILNKENKR